MHHGTTLIGGWGLRAQRFTVALLLGATWPDVQWIVLHIARRTLPPDLCVSATFFAQPFSSPFMCLWAGVLFACCVRPSPERWRQGAAFTAAAWFHLLLDACQTRYGNGVALLYPVSLRLYGFELFWEEGTLGWIALIGSAGIVGCVVRRGVEPVPWARPPMRLTAALIVGYLALPCATWSKGYADNTFGMAFVRDPASFEGKEVGFERNTLVSTSPPILRTWYGRDLPLRGVPDWIRPGTTVSVRGVYRNGALEVAAVHVHQPHLHTLPSIVALLALTIVLWRATRGRSNTW